MPRKRSVKLSATDFVKEVDSIVQFLATVSAGQSDEHVSWLHNYAIIKLYKEFEGKRPAGCPLAGGWGRW